MSEKKYELTLDEIDMLILLSASEVLRRFETRIPKRCAISAGISIRIQEHLEGTRPFSKRDIEDYKLAGILTKRFMEGFNDK